MPHLQFEINRPIGDTAKISLANEARELFAKIMGTGTDHISITVRECETHDLSIGRVTDSKQGVALVNADLRRGRTLEQRRALALGFIKLLRQSLGIPPANVYITLTEHPGEDFQLSDRYLSDWREDEDRKT